MSGIIHVPFHVIVPTARREAGPILDGRIRMMIPLDEDDHVAIFRFLDDNRIEFRSMTIIVLLGHHIPDPPVNLDSPSKLRLPPAFAIEPAIVDMDACMSTHTSLWTGMGMVPQPAVPDLVLFYTSLGVFIVDDFTGEELVSMVMRQ